MESMMFQDGVGYEVDDESCSELVIPGCTNPAASNYDAAANLNIFQKMKKELVLLKV